MIPVKSTHEKSGGIDLSYRLPSGTTVGELIERRAALMIIPLNRRRHGRTLPLTDGRPGSGQRIFPRLASMESASIGPKKRDSITPSGLRK